MTDILTQLDVLPPDAVPAQCLLIADFLGESGDPEAEGWMALGRLGKVPLWWPANEHHDGFWMWLDTNSRILHHFEAGNALPVAWEDETEHGGMWFPTRRSALSAAAIAFVGLDDGAKREILDSVKEVMA